MGVRSTLPRLWTLAHTHTHTHLSVMWAGDQLQVLSSEVGDGKRQLEFIVFETCVRRKGGALSLERSSSPRNEPGTNGSPPGFGSAAPGCWRR